MRIRFLVGLSKDLCRANDLRILGMGRRYYYAYKLADKKF